MRCKPIFIEQPGLKYASWQFHSLLFSHSHSHSRSHSIAVSLFSYLFSIMSLNISLQLEPRPFGIPYRWTWSSRPSSGRRSTRRKRRGTGWWRRPFKDWRPSWTAGGMVMVALLTCWQHKKKSCENCCRDILAFSECFLMIRLHFWA